jgi:hypothetical protein
MHSEVEFAECHALVDESVRLGRECRVAGAGIGRLASSRITLKSFKLQRALKG